MSTASTQSVDKLRHCPQQQHHLLPIMHIHRQEHHLKVPSTTYTSATGMTGLPTKLPKRYSFKL
eukprot:9496103-Ditylum_brightwellii.AAC.1